MGYQIAISLCKLPEDKSYAEEEASHHVAISSLYEIDYFQSLTGLPSAEQEHDKADKIWDGGGNPRYPRYPRCPRNDSI